MMATSFLKFDALPTGITQLLVFIVNARGLASKIRMLLALLVDFQPDVVCLQEAGPLFADDTLKGVPFRSSRGPRGPRGAWRRLGDPLPSPAANTSATTV